MNRTLCEGLTLNRSSFVLGTLFLIAVLVAGCGGSTPAPGNSETPPGESGYNPGTIPMGIGDVEATTYMTAKLNARSNASNVEVTELKSRRGRTNLVTIDIAPPVPDQFWLTFGIHTDQGYVGHAVVAKGRVLVGEEPVYSFHAVFGSLPSSGENDHVVNVFEGMTEFPETLLVIAEADLMLFKDTNPASIDPETADATADMTVTVRSNPVRINMAQ